LAHCDASAQHGFIVNSRLLFQPYSCYPSCGQTEETVLSYINLLSVGTIPITSPFKNGGPNTN